VPGSGRFRAQSFGELLDSSFTVYRRKFLPILAITALFELPYLVVEFFAERSPLATLLGLSTQPPPATTAAALGELGTVTAALLVILAVSLGYYILLMPLAQGGVIRVVSDDYLDRPTGVGPGLATALSRIGALVGYVLLELLIGVGPIVPGFGIALLAGSGGLLLLFLLAWVVWVIFVFIKMCLGIQAVVLERLAPGAAVRRSFQLTAGSYWRIFLFYVVIIVVSSILSGVLSGLTGLVIGAAPDITRASIEVVTSGIISIFTSPFILILLTLVYYDIRIRREAFDIEMLAQSL